MNIKVLKHNVIKGKNLYEITGIGERPQYFILKQRHIDKWRTSEYLKLIKDAKRQLKDEETIILVDKHGKDITQEVERAYKELTGNVLSHPWKYTEFTPLQHWAQGYAEYTEDMAGNQYILFFNVPDRFCYLNVYKDGKFTMTKEREVYDNLNKYAIFKF